MADEGCAVPDGNDDDDGNPGSSSMENSYQLDFDYESPVRPPRRWASLNSGSAPQLNASDSALFKSPRRSISSSGAHGQKPTTAKPNCGGTTTTKATTTSFHDSMSHLHAAATATTSSGSYLRSNFKAITKSTCASQWQLPTTKAPSEGLETPDWMRKLKHNKGGEAESAAPHQNGVDNTLPEWKKKFLEMKGGSSPAVGEDEPPEKTASLPSASTSSNQHERKTQQKDSAIPPEREINKSQSRGAAAASATPEWKRKFLQMKIATDAAQSHEEEALVQLPGSGRDGGGGAAATDSEDSSPSSPSSLPVWKKSIAKSRQVQAELLSLGLGESSKPVEPSGATPKAKGMSSSKENDGTPEWMKKFQSMKFEKEESVIEAGGKQDPGVVTNGNGVVVSWIRSTTTQTKTTTTVMEETEKQHTLTSTTKAKTRRADVAVERVPPESPSPNVNAQPMRSSSDSSDRPATDIKEIFCQLCDRRGHSAKECPQLLATQHETMESAENTAPMSSTSACDNEVHPDPLLDEHVKVKKKKKKSKRVQELTEIEETPAVLGSNIAADFDGARATDTDLTSECAPIGIDEPEPETSKKKKKKKKLTDSETVEECDHAAAASQSVVEPVEACTPASPAHDEVSHPEHCPDIVGADTLSKTKRKKKKAAAVVESDNAVETPSPAPVADDPSGQEPAVESTESRNAGERDATAAMNESFSLSELSSDPAKARRKKKKSRKDDSDECIGEITFDSQSEVSKTGAATEATAPMNESYSSTGESSADLHSRDRSSRMRKPRRKKQEKDETAGRMSESCSSLEASVVSAPSKSIGFVGEVQAGSASCHAKRAEGCTPRDDEGEFDVPETSSTSHQSSCAGSKSSSSQESTLSSKGSSFHQEGPSETSRAAKERILEERVQIVNTLNAFLDQTKERMANRESRIPEGSLRANKDDAKANQQLARRASLGACATPSEGSSRTNTKKSKSQSSARIPHRRRSCTGGSATPNAPVKREGSRRSGTNGQPPSSPRRRPGQSSKASCRRRVARDPEPDIKPAKGAPDADCDDVFRVVSHNASFQMSRQKICLPTDFEDFDEAELSDGISVHDAAVKSKKSDPFDDAFGEMLSNDTTFEVTETISAFQTLTVTTPATAGSFDRDIASTGFSFASFDGTGGKGDDFDDFSVDPFGQPEVFDARGKPKDLAGSFADESLSMWGGTSNEPATERRRSVDGSSSSATATKQQRRRNGEDPARLARRRSSTASRSNSFQGTR